jgi:hypothetical protein
VSARVAAEALTCVANAQRFLAGAAPTELAPHKDFLAPPPRKQPDMISAPPLREPS